MDEATHQAFRELIASRCGAHVKPQRSAFRDLTKYRTARGFVSDRAYLEHCQAHLEEELPNLYDYGLVHQTETLRDPEFWGCVRRLMQGRESIRAVSLGCSTGQELLTIACLACAVVGEARKFELHAYDISKLVVDRASHILVKHRFIYPFLATEQQCCIPAEGALVRLRPEIAAQIHVSVADARTVGLPADTFDFVFVRNLLLYLSDDDGALVVGTARRALKVGGYMGIGVADPRGPFEGFIAAEPLLYRVSKR
jgi:chemotaxis methyl-accepting protein methylase